MHAPRPSRSSIRNPTASPRSRSSNTFVSTRADTMLLTGLQRAGGQHIVPSFSKVGQKPRLRSVVRYLHHHDGEDLPDKRFPLSEGLALSLFHPYKRLPPEGTTLPLEEESCDPEENNCKTPLHVYEARCTVCSGTGWSRAPSNGRRGHLSTCIVCHGLGYVRRTTSRFCPDDPDKHMTIARPLTWNGKFAARSRPPSSNGNSSSSSGESDGSKDSSSGSSSSR